MDFADINIYEVAGNSAYIIFTASYLFKDIIWLRSATTLGCGTVLFYGYNVSTSPLWTMVIWNILFLIINVIHIIILLRERYGTNFTKEEREIYPYFSTMPAFEFRKLMKLSKFKKIPSESIILEENQEVDKLMFIIQGNVSIFKYEK